MSLTGSLLFVAWNMGEWHEFARLRHFDIAYRSTLLGTFGLTVEVQVGPVLACVFFISRMSKLCRAEPVDPATPAPGRAALPNAQVFRLFGALFFGAVAKVEAVGAPAA